MTNHPEWQANLANGKPFTLADLNKLVDSIEVPELADDEPPELARLTKDEFDREEHERITKAAGVALPGVHFIRREEVALFMGWTHADDCQARREGACNCGMSR